MNLPVGRNSNLKAFRATVRNKSGHTICFVSERLVESSSVVKLRYVEGEVTEAIHVTWMDRHVDAA